MPRDVEFTVPARSLGKSDVRFKVYDDGSLLGTLMVSKGAVVWFPRSTTKGHKVRWTEFDVMMRKRQRVERR